MIKTSTKDKHRHTADKLDSVCRVCLSNTSTNFTKLSESCKSSTVAEILKFCIGLEVSLDKSFLNRVNLWVRGFLAYFFY